MIISISNWWNLQHMLCLKPHDLQKLHGVLVVVWIMRFSPAAVVRRGALFSVSLVILDLQRKYKSKSFVTLVIIKEEINMNSSLSHYLLLSAQCLWPWCVCYKFEVTCFKCHTLSPSYLRCASAALTHWSSTLAHTFFLFLVKKLKEKNHDNFRKQWWQTFFWRRLTVIVIEHYRQLFLYLHQYIGDQKSDFELISIILYFYSSRMH